MIRGFLKLAALMAFCTSGMAFAQNYPSPLSPYVSDYADVIDAETEARITQVLQSLKAENGVEMRVVTINRVADYNTNISVPDFTTGMINTWGIGDASRNDGILFLTSIEEREMFIGLGSGYTPVYDDRMDRVFEYHVKPYYKSENYAKGIEVGVLETIKRSKADFVETREKDSIINKFFHYSVIGFIAFAGLRVIIGIIAKRRRRRADGSEAASTTMMNNNDRNDGGRHDGGNSGGNGGGGGGSSGGGGGGGW